MNRLLDPAGTAEVLDDVVGGRTVTKDDSRSADFDAQFELAHARLLGIAASLVGAHEAGDVVHDSYMLGRERYGQLRDPAAFEPWITRIAVNQCYGRHRRSGRLRSLLPRLLPRPQMASDVGLRELIEQLPPRERTVLVLHYGHGYGLEEIAELLGLTHTNVRTIIARTRKRLFAAWRAAEGHER